MKKRILCVLLCMLLVLAFGCTQPAPTVAPAETPAPLTIPTDDKANAPADGTYSVTARGHNDDLQMDIAIAKGKIDAITVTDHLETKGVSDPAFERLIPQIIEHQTITVDTITGCTFTCNAIIDGVG